MSGVTVAPTAPEVMAQARSENFPVASFVLPRRRRRHLLAIYGYCRLVDDIGDEVSVDARGELLDWVEGELDRIYAGGWPAHPLLRELVTTVRACEIPRATLVRLIDANRLDQTKARYETFGELLAYCDLSAAPVGELVLHAFGLATPERIALSDRVCAGLQITEHLQDVGEDRARGRVYLPQEDLERFGCDDDALLAPRVGAELRSVLELETARARELLDSGVPLVRDLPGRARLAVAAFVAGGRAALDALEREDFEVLGGRPRPPRRAFFVGWARALGEAR
jgi:squalene synthase HpnC